LEGFLCFGSRWEPTTLSPYKPPPPPWLDGGFVGGCVPGRSLGSLPGPPFFFPFGKPRGTCVNTPLWFSTTFGGDLPPFPPLFLRQPPRFFFFFFFFGRWGFLCERFWWLVCFLLFFHLKTIFRFSSNPFLFAVFCLFRERARKTPSPWAVSERLKTIPR